MNTNDPERNETVAQVLEYHDVDNVDDLPPVVQHMLEETPEATYDESHPLATTGGTQ